MGVPNPWTGNAAAKYHTFTVTYTTTATGTGAATVGQSDKAVSFAYVNGNTVGAVALGVFNLLQASTIPEIAEIAWTYPGTGGVITGTMKDAGVPAECVAAVTAATGISVAVANVVAPDGPNFINSAGNFLLGLPVNGQDVIFDGALPDVLYGFASMGWTGAPEVICRATYTGAFGLPKYRSFGGIQYKEFRKRFPVLPGTNNYVGVGQGAGCSRFNCALVTGGRLTVYKTGTASDATAVVNVFPILANTPDAINVFGGSLAIGVGDAVNENGAALTLLLVDGVAVVYEGYNGNLNISDLKVNGGNVYSQSQIGTVTVRGGTVTRQFGVMDNLVMRGGKFFMDCDQATDMDLDLSAVSGRDAPILDCSRTKLERHFTGIVSNGAAVLDPNGSAEFDAVTFDAPSLKASEFGTNVAVTVSPI